MPRPMPELPFTEAAVVGRVIRALRAHSGESQQTFAMQVGIGTSSLARVESGKQAPSFSVLWGVESWLYEQGKIGTRGVIFRGGAQALAILEAEGHSRGDNVRIQTEVVDSIVTEALRHIGVVLV